jgi:hypothetical protein
VSNPATPTSHDGIHWDETTSPPVIVDPPPVTLVAPATVQAIFAYSTEPFVYGPDDHPRTIFETWQQRVSSAQITLRARSP